MEKIKRSKLVEFLKSIPKGATFVSVAMSTEPSMVKKHRVTKDPNPWLGRVRKHAVVSGMLHYDYESNVNAQRAREGKAEDFVVQAPKWGVRVGDTCIFEHKGTLYMDMRALRCLRTRYFADGKRIAKVDVDEWLSKSGPSPKQNLREEIVVRRPKIESIRRINVNKRKFEVVDD